MNDEIMIKHIHKIYQYISANMKLKSSGQKWQLYWSWKLEFCCQSIQATANQWIPNLTTILLLGKPDTKLREIKPLEIFFLKSRSKCKFSNSTKISCSLVYNFFTIRWPILFSVIISNSNKIHYITRKLTIHTLPNAAHASSFWSKLTSLQLASYNLTFSLKFPSQSLELQFLKK